jgi:hypothetical protein
MSIKIQECTILLQIRKPKLRELFFIVRGLGKMKKMILMKRKVFFQV